MKRKLVTFVLTGLLAFSTTGMVFAESEPVADPTASDPPIISEDPSTEVITIGATIETALKAVPNGAIVSIKLDKQHAVKIYKVQIRANSVMSTVKINAVTGEVLNIEQEDNLDKDDPTDTPIVPPTTDPTSNPTVDPTAEPATDPTADPTAEPAADPIVEDPDAALPAISFENAIQIALDSVTNGSFVSIRLGSEHDVLIYKVIVQTGKKSNQLKIDATTGAIIKPANDKNDKKTDLDKSDKKSGDDSSSQSTTPKTKGKK